MSQATANEPLPADLHPHALVLRYMPSDYYDYESSILQWGSVEPYEVSQKIGRGKYSEVFRGRNRLNGEVCVVKVLKPVKSKKINREITILQNLWGGPNVVKLLDLACDAEADVPVLVFENVDNVDYRQHYPKMNTLEVRFYIFEILKALDFCHSMGIMHRDIKPQNIMYDPKRRKLRVIDWGLGEYYHHGTAYNVRVASRYYKGPELLVGLRAYDYGLDMWSVGCVLGGIIFQRDPLFQGRDNNDQLQQIIGVLGSEALERYVQKYHTEPPNDFNHGLLKLKLPCRPWSSFVTPAVQHLCDSDAIDLLDKMLRYDHRERITPREAMMHPYFNAVRDECLSYGSSGCS